MLKLTIFVIGIYFIANTNAFFLPKTQPKCAITTFKATKEFSGENIMANKTFVPKLKTIGTVAKECKVRVHVTESYRSLKNPSEFVLSRDIPLTLGTGINFDLQDVKGGTLCNKLCMTSRSWKTLPEAACFINGVQKKGIRFVEPNHLDDGTTAKLSITQADALKEAQQKLCAPKTKETKG